MAHNYAEFETNVKQMRVNHRDFNHDKNHNIEEIPEIKAVFGLFDFVCDQGVDKPLHCRFVGRTENLREMVVEVYQQTEDIGLQKFMSGPWIKMLCYLEVENIEDEANFSKEKKWIDQFKPANKEDGEYLIPESQK
jgi:hypothetical protein